MVLGDLPGIKNLLPAKEKKLKCFDLTKRIELSKLEVVRLFHVSPVKNRESILAYGLLPKSYLGSIISYPPRIYVSAVYEEAAFDYVSHECVDVWAFHLPKHLLHTDEFSSFANHYFIKERVPWYKLELVETRY